MLVMLSRNRVKDYAAWRRIFDANAGAARAAGLELMHLWRDTEDPNNVFFVLKVADVRGAKAFIGAPEAAETGTAAGVLDGEYHFLTSE